MGTHPIFESDFDCLTEMSRIFNESLDNPNLLDYSGAYIYDFGNGIQMFETDQMRQNFQIWRNSRAADEDVSFLQYLTDLLMGNYTAAPKATPQNQIADITKELHK